MGLWVMPEHTDPYLVRNPMTQHWGCLSNEEPYWLHCGSSEREREMGWEKEDGMRAGDERVG